MLENIASGTQSVSLEMGAADTAGLPPEIRSEIGDRPIIEISLSIDGSTTAWSNDNVPVTISIPYTPKAGENHDNIVVWYIDSQGKANVVSTGRYNSVTGTVTFDVNHFSTYAVSYYEKTFDDIKTTWGKKEIEFLATRGIIKGDGTKYLPKDKILRADFAKLLMGVINKKASITGSFIDVVTTDYFYNEVMTANALGIINGVGGDRFAPREYINRQDMMVMMDRALKVSGIELSAKADLSVYTDVGEIAGYADDPAAKLIASGIIQGSDGKLSPKGSLTREEAARVLYLVYMMLY
jgi:hypothetical protein